MTASERWDEESFLRLMRDVMPERPDGDDEPVNLAAERQNNRRVIADLIAQGIPEEFAQKALLAIAGGKVQDAHIKY